MSQATIGALRVVLGLDSAQFTEGMNAAQRHLQGVSRRFQRVGDQMAGIGRSLSMTVTAPIVALGVTMSRTAIDAEEMASAFNVSFGGMADDARAWAEATGDAMGRSTQEMQRGMLTMHGLFKAGGDATDQTRELAQQFAVLAQDLSSFHNVSPEDALNRLRSGLSGEAEPLRRFNVYLTEAAVRARAVELGLAATTAEVSEQAKIMARASLIMEATTEAQGDVERTSESTANQIRRAQAAWEELSVTIGSRILPVITPLVEKLANLAESFGRLSPQTQTFIMAAAGIAAVVGPLLMFIGGVTSAIGALLPVMTAAGSAVAGFAAAVTSPAWAPVALTIAAIAAAIGLLVVAWNRIKDTVLPILQRFQERLNETIGPKLRDLAEKVRPIIEAIGVAWSALWERVEPVFNEFLEWQERLFGQALEALLDGSIEAISTYVDGVIAAVDWITRAWRAMQPIVETVFRAIGDGLSILGDLLTGDFSGAWETARNAIRTYCRDIYEAVRTWLLDRLTGVFDQVQDRIEMVGDGFYTLWDRVVGHSYIPDLVEDIAAWMARLDQGMVRPALDATEETAEAFRDLADDVEAIFDRLLTTSQRAMRDLRRDMATLDQALAAGVISQAEYDAAANGVQAGNLTIPGLTPTSDTPAGFDAIQGAFGQMQDEIANTRDAWGQAFASGIEAAANGNLTDLLRSWVSGWARQGLESLGRMLFDQFGRSGIGNIFTQAIGSGGGKLPGFATGGSLKVGGRSGIDKNVVAFRATRGEMVDIRKPGRDIGSGRSLSFDLRGAVMTEDLLGQMQEMAAMSGGMAYQASMAGVPEALGRRGRNRLGR